MLKTLHPFLCREEYRKYKIYHHILPCPKLCTFFGGQMFIKNLALTHTASPPKAKD